MSGEQAAKSRWSTLLEPAIGMALATALLFFVGWLYTENYYAYFGIDHRTLSFPVHHYLISPWFVILMLIVYALPYVMRFYEPKEKPPANGPQAPSAPVGTTRDAEAPPRWKVIGRLAITIFRTVFSYLAPVAAALFPVYMLLASIGEDKSTWIMVILGLHILTLLLWVRSSRVDDSGRKHAGRLLAWSILLCLTLGWSLGIIVSHGRTVAMRNSVSGVNDLPYIRFAWKDSSKYKSLDWACATPPNMKLLYTLPDSFIVFRPRLSESDPPPLVLWVPKCEVSYHSTARNQEFLTMEKLFETFEDLKRLHEEKERLRAATPKTTETGSPSGEKVQPKKP